MQHEQLLEPLAQLGLSGDEARVYLALQTATRGYVSAIAKRAGVHRVSCYHILDALVEKRAAVCSEQQGRKVYEAVSAEGLVKQQVLKLRIAERILPEIKALSRSRPTESRIRQIEGADAVRAVFEETLSTADEIVGYSDVDRVAAFLGDYLHYYFEERGRRRIRSRLLSPLSQSGKSFLATYFPGDVKRELAQIVFVDPQEFSFENEVYIFGDSVAVLALVEGSCTGVVIQNALTARTWRSIFNLSWLGATSFVIS